MTEEIIIDGVDVWSCKHYDLENNYCDQSYLGEGGLLKNTIIQNDIGKYRVRLQINRVKYDKTFDTLEKAIEYRNELETKYHKKEEIICPI